MKMILNLVWCICALGNLFVSLICAENNLSKYDKENSKNEHKVKKMCQNGYFISYEEDKIQCKVCSVCPQDQIIRKLCTSFNDTVCGPFYEFQSFHQEKEIELSHSFPHEPVNAKGKFDFKNEGNDSSVNGTHSTKYDATHSDRKRIVSSPVSEHLLDDEQKIWRKISFGLVGALTIITLIGLIYELYKIIQNRRKKSIDNACDTAANNNHAYQRVNPSSNATVKLRLFNRYFGTYTNCWFYQKLFCCKNEHRDEAPQFLPLFLTYNNMTRAVDNNYVPEPFTSSNCLTLLNTDYSNTSMTST